MKSMWGWKYESNLRILNSKWMHGDQANSGLFGSVSLSFYYNKPTYISMQLCLHSDF